MTMACLASRVSTMKPRVSCCGVAILLSAPLSSSAFVVSLRRQRQQQLGVARSATWSRSFLSTPSLQATTLAYGDVPSLASSNTTVVVGKKVLLEQLDLPSLLDLSIDPATMESMLASISDSGSASTYIGAHRLSLGVLPDKVSRHNHRLSPHTLTELVAGAVPSKGATRLLLVDDALEESQGALVSAVAKAFPIYNKKSKSEDEATVQVSLVNANGQVSTDESVFIMAQAVSEGVQLAARLVDMPPEELTTDAYSAECRKIADELGVTMTEIVGDELQLHGYGAIYGVGKAAVCPPRLVVLEYDPPQANENVALVGKGIIYDTGGLSLKPKDGMAGMKGDMGGSAGMLGGFMAAVKLKVPKKITLILCLAENAIGPGAFRNDDILTLYSGKTVEVNNCDAEGRLVLGDGVAHATKNIPNLDLVVDMATLTGAQLVTTGKKHAGILANTEEVEKRAMAAGMKSGDLVYPMLYCPELLKKEFNSKVADMKNSVKDRSNAQSSCAGHFIESHLDENYKGGWLHVDMAGPAKKDERGTGYGVGLVLSLLEAPGF